ncbi:MAG: hypothetical protein AAGA71_08515 [Pseudomonadota bacterium]
MRPAYKYCVGAIASLMVLSPASAARDLVRDFAVCTGRLSAEMEHSWLMQDGRGDATQTRRDAMADLLTAVTDADNALRVYDLRINAKLAHSSLLTQASFGPDRDQAERARRLAKAHVAGCTAFLLA